MNIKRYIIVLLSIVMAIGAWAQNATSSPSSRFGYGELNDNLPGAYRAMGGVGLGMRSNKAINSAQPASYTACDSLTFMFDIAGSFLYTSYGDSYGKRSRMNGNLEYVTLQFPLWRQYIALSVGVTPYSAMGYELSESGVVDSAYHYTHTYSGEGGFTQVYGGLSFNICNWVALGANVYYMFGDMTKIRSQYFAESDVKGASQKDYLRVNSLRVRYGLQFFHTFGRHTVVLGGVFENKQRFSRSEYLQLESTTNDTVSVMSNCFEMPMTYGAGASYNYADRLIVGLDYQRQDWSNTLYFDATSKLRNRDRWSLGVEYRHDPTSRNYVDRMCWRLGANYTTSYAMNQSMPEFGVSAGLGLPLRTIGTVINATVEYVHRGAMSGKDLLSENSLRLVVNASIAEHWFFKRKL